MRRDGRDGTGDLTAAAACIPRNAFHAEPGRPMRNKKKPASNLDWETVVDRMVTLGASVTPAEQQTLLEYLNGLEK